MTLLALLLTLSLGAQAQPAPTASEKAEVVVRQLAAGEFAPVEARFTDKMKAALPDGRLATIWGGLIAQVGAFKKELGSREQDIGSARMGIVTCEFERATLKIQIAFDAEGRVAGLTMRPATPAAPYALPAYADAASFTESDVTIGSGDWALPGTLTLPTGPGPFPVVILVHGSGPNDRDETILGNKPFKDLAGGLASRGIAVLRYDKRTKVHAAKMAALTDLTVKEEVIDDVVAAVAAMRANPRIDAKKLFVLGHSLGGMLIPRIAAADPSLAGLIVMAGAARPLEQAILEQLTYLARADGTISPEEQKGIDEARQNADAIHALTPADAAARKVVEHVPASYWLDLRGYDPPTAAKTLTQPMLVLQGGRDYQVTPEEFARWKQALESKPNATFRLYPALNHIFVAGEGKSLPAEYEKAGHVDEQVVNDIAVWIKAVGGKPASPRARR